MRTHATRTLLATAVLCALSGCDNGKAGSRGFSFEERSKAAGITFVHTDGSSGQYYIVETLASGVGLFDYNGDGRLDIYFLNGRPLPPGGDTPLAAGASATNVLYRNDGGLKFSDVTKETGLEGVGFSIGCCAGDYDNDGDLDLYVACYGRNVLYRNDGGTFTDVTADAGVDDTHFSAGAIFFDIENDGDLDLYVTNYCEVNFATDTACLHNGVPGYCAPGQYKPVNDALFRNRGDGTFEDISVASGIAAEPKWGMGVLAYDRDGDGLQDLYVANDVSDNFLFKNLGAGKFENIAMIEGVAVSGEGDEQGSMGLDIADYTRDGEPDIVVTNYQKQLNALYQRDGDIGYTDVAMRDGLGVTCLPNVSWGTALADFDNDGWRDLFIANGHLEDRIAEYDHSSTYLQQNQLFRNESGRFVDVSDEVGVALRERLSSRGAAFGDLDDDGDLDIVVVNSRARPSLLVNEGGNARSWIRLRLKGKTNRFAIGARVTIEAGGVKQVAEVRSGGSYVSQNDLRVHFGLGEATMVDRVTVRWPGGGESTFEKLAARKEHTLEES